jgi:serine/threonine protein kinase
VFAPTTFGKYYLAERLAGGGMAEIYKAKLLGPGGFEKLLVIKQIKPDLARRREFVEMFVDEAKVTVQLSHGNIVPVYELGMIDGTYFIAMEYVDGPALRQLLAAARRCDRRLGAPLAAHIAVEVLKGLDYAHRQHILHRDLSPGNVVLSRQGEVKIVDFGLATSAARLEGGKLVGSYAYMSPEQAEGDALDARSDLFSLGVLLWEMLTGRALFTRPTDQETLGEVKAAQVPPPSTLAADVPPALDQVVLRALMRDPRERYGRAAEFQADLVRLLYSAGSLPQQHDVGAFVRELCPPDVDESATASPSGETTAAAGPAGRHPPAASNATPLLGTALLRETARAQAEVSFATNVAFEREVLTRVGSGTPATGVPTGDVATTGPRRTRVLRRRRRRLRLVVAGTTTLVAGVTLAAVLVGTRRTPAPPLELGPPAAAAAGATPGAPSFVPQSGVAPKRPAPNPSQASTHARAVPTAVHRDSGPRGATPAGGPVTDTHSGVARTATSQGDAAEGRTEGAWVTLNATPWADFYLDGKRLAGCPVVRHPAPPGVHQVRVVCPDRQERTQRVELGEGVTARQVFDCTQTGIPLVGL